MRQATAQNPQLVVSYFQYLLAKKNVSPNVVSLDRGKLDTWRLAQVWSPKSTGTNDDEGKYHRFIKQRVVNNSTVTSVATGPAGGLVVGLSNDHDGFRLGDVVYSEKMKFGRIVAVVPGSMTIEPAGAPAALVNTTDFLVGEKVYLSHDRSGNKWSDAKSYLYTKKDMQTDYVEVQRDACGLARREKIKTHVGGASGVIYTYTDDEVEMVDRMLMGYTKKIWLSEPMAPQNSGYQGMVNGTRGIRRSIKTDGAANLTSNGQITKAILEDMVMEVAEVHGGSYDKGVTIHPGRRAHKRISEFYPEQLAQSGSRWAGKYQEVNLDVRTIQIAGITVNIVPLSWLNDQEEVPDWFKDSVYIMDMNQLPSANNMGMESPFQRIHWTDGDASTAEEKIYKVTPGLTSHEKGNGTGGVMVGGYELTTSSLDGYHVDMAMDNGCSYIADASALFEFPH